MPLQTTSGPARSRLILFLLWILFYASFTLFTPRLLDDADSVHAEVAREMLLRHDWVTLYANGIRYLEKAPVFYWAEAACMAVLGPTTVASRIPLALAVLGLTLLLEAFGRRAFASARAGLYAGLITLSSFGVFIFSRINIPDVLVCAFLTLAVVAYQQRRPYLFAFACALNVLTKGLIGIVFPVAIVGLFLLLADGLRANLKRVLRPTTLYASVLFLVIAAPWHILAGLHNATQGQPGGLTYANGHFAVPLPTDGNVHGWAWFYFINEQVLRYLNLRVPRDYDTVPLLLFYGLIFVWLMPWSAFLPGAFARALPLGTAGFRARLRAHTLAPVERTNLLLVLWAAIPLVFFSLSTRQEYYVLPALPPMILLIAALLAEASHPVLAAFTQRATTRIAVALLVAGSVAAAACVFFIVHTKAPAANTDLASLLQQNPGDYALSFGHFLDLNAQALGLFRLPLSLTAVAFLAGTLGHYLLRRRGQPHAATLALAAGAFVFLFAAHQGLVIFSPTLTSAQLADAIRPQLHPEDLIAIHGEYEAGSTLGFYLRRNDLHIVEGRSSNLWYGSFFPDAPKIFESRESIAQRWAGSQRIFLWQDPNDRDRPVLSLNPVYVIANSGGKQILSNRPNR